MNMFNRIMRSAMPLALLLLAACNGGGGGTAAPAAVTTTSYTVGGTVSGLTGSVVLQNNNSGNLTSVTANGVFTFPSQNASGSLYSVSVFSQPTGQTCSVSTGAGTISGNNVSNVAVVCATNAYNVGGNVTGLTGSVVLQDNSGDNLTVAANGVYTFATNVANGSPYSVTVLTQPSATMSCSVANGTGTISLAAVTNVTITCAANSYTVGGTATGLNGSVVFQDNGADNLTVSVNGPFNFPTAVFYNNPYSVSILTQPAMQRCSVNMGAGTVTANVGNVALSCISLLGGAVKNVVPGLAAPSATPVVSTIAGTASRNLDGTGGAARFYGPTSSVSDGTNLYVADINNHEIRQIVIATGVVTTLAGTGSCGSLNATGTLASFCYPQGITIDSAGTNLYVSDTGNNVIRQIVIATGAVTSLAAGFSNPVGIATDGTNLYVADTNNGRIAQVVIASGAVTTLAGYGWNSCCTIVNGTGTAASFYYPQGITTDGTSLYVADRYDNAIRQITPATGTLAAMTSANAVVSTLAGAGPYYGGSVDGTGTAAQFNQPQDITTDGTNVYVADTNNNEIRQVVIASGVVSTLAGQVGVYSATDGTGKAATFNNPIGITSFGGNLYVADINNNIIRQIVTATGAVTTLAGAKPGADGTGVQVTFNSPGSTTTDGTNLYVVDSNNNTIRQIVIATGVTTTLAGEVGESGSVDGIGAQARFNYPQGITTDGTNLYVTDSNNNTIRQIVIAGGAVSTLAGAGPSAYGSVDGIGAEALFNYPMGITTDGTNLYVADSSNSTIRKIVIATRAVTTLAGSVNSYGSTDATGTAASFSYVTGLTTDGTNLYVADQNNQKIRQIVIATGVVTTLAGTGGYGSTDGAGVTTATFYNPSDITTDGTNLYVTNSNYNDIRQIVIATGVVSTLAGSIGGSSGSADGAALTATFNYPVGITSDGQSLYVTDSNNGTIRKIQ